MSLYSLMNEPDDGDNSKTTSAKQKREEVIALGVAGGALALFLVIGLFAYRDKYRRDKYYKTFGYDKVIGDDVGINRKDTNNNNKNDTTTTTAAVNSNNNSNDGGDDDDSRRNSNNNIVVNQGRMSTSKTYFRTAVDRNAETSDDSFARNIHQISSDNNNNNNKSNQQFYSQHQYRYETDHSVGSPPRSKANYTRDYHDADDDKDDENNNSRRRSQQNLSGLHQPRTDLMENIKRSLSSENGNSSGDNGKSNNNLHANKHKEQQQSGEKSHLLS